VDYDQLEKGTAMLLLYCFANGEVGAYHDDNQAPVPMSAYPGVVRIIPYNQPLQMLERSGDPIEYPPNLRPAPPDTRPYKQPDPTPEILIGFCGQMRFQTVDDGFTFNAASGPFHVNGDRTSYMLVGNTAKYAETLTPTADLNFTQASEVHVVKASEWITLFNQFTQLIQDARSIEATCLADLRGAQTIKTYEDVEARFAPLGATYRSRSRA
jgi:hypothetical protein